MLDIDDTLYLERDYIRSGFDAVENALDIPGFAAASWSLFLAGHRGTIFNRALDALGMPAHPDRIEAMVTRYREHTPSITLLPDVTEWIHQPTRGYHLACISDGPLTSQRAKVTALGLDATITDSVLTGRYGPGFGKPHPRAFQDIAAASGFAAHEYVYVADNPIKDFSTPHALGWHTIRMRRPLSLHEARATPNYVSTELSDFTTLDAALMRLGAAHTPIPAGPR